MSAERQLKAVGGDNPSAIIALEPVVSDSESDCSLEMQSSLLAAAILANSRKRSNVHHPSVAEHTPLKKRKHRHVIAATGMVQSLVQPLRPVLSAPTLSALQRDQTDVATKAINSIKPEAFLRQILRSASLDHKTVSFLAIKDFFCEANEEGIAAYTIEVTKAVREQDIDKLRAHLESGKTLQCANRFGESIVHIACRRGSTKILEFLLNEAKVDCRVVCDYGRTSLHDACWTSKPNFVLVGLLLDRCPDLLYVTDKRGFTPLDYVRAGEHGAWCKFLAERGIDKLLPQELKL